ncbi:MAG: EF-hand domain-containing protein [Candidatus Zixiibacteriota bacterium]
MVNGIQGFSDSTSQTMAAMREKMFSRLDPDGDGQIDLAELTAQSQEAGKSDEFMSRMIEDLTAADTNGDGMVSFEEFEQMPPPPPPPDGAPPPGGGDLTELFNQLDADGDGQIDLAELQSQLESSETSDSRMADLIERLSAADTNGDGLVSQTEFKQAAMAHQSETAYSNVGSLQYSSDSSTTIAGLVSGELINQLA